MVILFFIIHAIFAITFFMLGRTIEMIIFTLLAFFSLFLFNTLFIKKEFKEKQDKKQGFSLSILSFAKYLKKGIYLLSTALFYISLYSIAYSINYLYGYLSLATLFGLLTLVISLAISFLFFIRINKNNETIVLIFRSNFIIYSLFYLVLFFITKRSLDPLFVINALISFFGLISILVRDERLSGPKRTMLFILFLVYLFSFLFTYGSIVIPNITLLLLLDSTLIVLFSYEIIPNIPALGASHEIAKNAAIFIAIFVNIVIPCVEYGHFMDMNILFLETINALFLFSVYGRLLNRVALIFWLGSLVFLYARILFWFFSSSALLYFSFTFFLPYVLLGVLIFTPWIRPVTDRLILIGYALFFATAYTVYYFVVFRGLFDMLAFSIALFCASILFFLAFLSFRTKQSYQHPRLF